MGHRFVDSGHLSFVFNDWQHAALFLLLLDVVGAANVVKLNRTIVSLQGDLVGKNKASLLYLRLGDWLFWDSCGTSRGAVCYLNLTRILLLATTDDYYSNHGK